MVDLRAGEVRLPDTKNGRARTLAVEGRIAEVLERRRALRRYNIVSTEDQRAALRQRDAWAEAQPRKLRDFQREG